MADMTVPAAGAGGAVPGRDAQGNLRPGSTLKPTVGDMTGGSTDPNIPTVATTTTPTTTTPATTSPSTTSNPEGGPTTVSTDTGPEGGPTTVPVPAKSDQPQVITPTGPSTPATTTGTGTGTGGSTGSTTTGTSTGGSGVAATAAATSLAAQLEGVTEENSLNAYYIPTYHLRLFVAGEADLLTLSDDTLSNITSGKVPQVTIAESGVTGVSIKEAEIHTVFSHTATSKDQHLQNMTMTVIDPLGMSFLDGLVDAGKVMNVHDFTKMPYYVELTFKAYDESGYAVAPTNLPNGGLWIWAVTITDLEVKLNEGGGKFILKMDTIGSGGSPTSKSNKDEAIVPQQSLMVSGKTVKDIFQDLTNKLNTAWANSAGGEAGSSRVTVNGIVTKPISIGPSKVDPGTWVLKSVNPYQSSQKQWRFDGADSGSVTCTVPPDASVSEVITNILRSTEEGQKLMKGESVTTSLGSTNSFREVVVFAVETDVTNSGFDLNSRSLMKSITFHVTPHYEHNVIITSDQVDKSTQPATQNAILATLISKGLVKKRYDYIFTGLNTEVLNVNMDWNFSWNAILPKLAGARMGYNNSSVNGQLHPGNKEPSGTRVEAEKELAVTPDTAVTTASSTTSTGAAAILDSNGAVAGRDAQGNLRPGSTLQPTVGDAVTAIASPLTTVTPAVTSMTTPSTTSTTDTATSTASTSTASSTTTSTDAKTLGTAATSIVQGAKTLASGILKAVTGITLPTSSTTATTIAKASSQVNGGQGNIYIEDLVDQTYQTPTLPISFKYGNNDVSSESGSRTSSGQYHRDQSVMGAIFTQIYRGNDLMNSGKLQTIELEIRGDPYWLGQTNINRSKVMRSTAPSHDPSAAPDFVSAKEVVYFHFRYPLTVGDDFVPILATNEAFDGFYEVYDVTHTLIDGEFRQKLLANRLPLLATTGSATASTGGSDTPSGGAGASPTIVTPVTKSATVTPMSDSAQSAPISSGVPPGAST